MVPSVSVIVPCRNEERYIARCLESIFATDHPRDRFEVLVVDGHSEDRTRAIVAEFVSRYPMLRVLDNPERIQPVALNIGIRAATGDILVRMDAHAFYPKNYITDLAAALQQSGADNVGGVLVTDPATETPVGKAIALALSHPFGVGNAYFRIGSQQARWVDHVAFFCCRRETFERIGMFDEKQRDEDSEFNARIIGSGGRVLLVPSVVAHYYARSTLPQVARMFYHYGYSKPLVVRKLGRVMTARQLVPPAFLLVLAGSAVLAPWLRPAALVLAVTAGAYLVSVLASAIGAARKAGFRTTAALALVFPIVHGCYGFGFLRSLFDWASRSRSKSLEAGLPVSR
ncbi:MAG TPA: glycosyltransferase family 2 protein [Gemmatimonadales bacterium]|nr:glycosyltransferase family 2 protein [Gemmatimonadales bacterium]